MPMSASQVDRLAKQKEKEEREHREKELQKRRYDEEMKSFADGALSEAKKSNKIAMDGLKIATDSKLLSEWAVVIAVLSVLISIILHFC